MSFHVDNTGEDFFLELVGVGQSRRRILYPLSELLYVWKMILTSQFRIRPRSFLLYIEPR